MKQTLILLSSVNAKWIHPSLALRLLKANLRELEDFAEILEFNLRQNFDEKISGILAVRPRILALSVSIWNHTETLRLLAALKKAWRQEPVVVLGGPEVSWLGADAELFRYADHVIRGEGETAFRELCRAVLDGGRVPKFIDAPLPDTSLLLPAYRLYSDEDLARKLTYVEASRGCPFGCEFCQSSITPNDPAAPGVREFPLEAFLAEMDVLIRRGARTFKFLDRSFNINVERAIRIMEFFLERLQMSPCGNPPFTVHFEMIPLRFPPELRKILGRFPPGSLRLEIGIQTLNRKTAALVKRPGDPGEELQILRFLARETSAIIHADLIAGLPGEDLSGFGKGFDLLWEALQAESPHGLDLPPPGSAQAEIQPGILKLLPGTAMIRHNEAFGMRYAPDPPYEVRQTSALSTQDLDRIKNFARFWELIVNRGAFPSFVPALLPSKGPVFERFMKLSDNLFARFGRNWGIDKKRLEEALGAFE
ncbi:MAG: DUF4080 domain-containing protein [Treponema sp.]|jgi:radical SAM superfamily enzyme YgiQ (UPF0313 family)|nr:DUF4080 domain-containing protein [Treponema sp.]